MPPPRSRRPILAVLVAVPIVALLALIPTITFPPQVGSGDSIAVRATKSNIGGRGVGRRRDSPTRAAPPVTMSEEKHEEATPEGVMGHYSNGDEGVGVVSDKLTVVLMSYPGSSRFAVLVKILKKVAQWPIVLEVLLVWNGDESKVPSLLSEAMREINAKAAANEDGKGTKPSPTASVRLLPQEFNRIDNRWRLGRQIRTEGILNMDDDVNLYEDGALCMFNVWQSSPQSIISVDVRSHFSHADKSKQASQLGPFGPWGYAARDTVSEPSVKKYSVGLPRVLLTSRKHLLEYEATWLDESSGLKDIVDRLLCDDIALNFVAANRTDARRRNSGIKGSGEGAAGVIYVKAHFDPYPESHSADGLTKQKGMKEKRQRCVNELAGRFGMALKPRSWHVLCSVDG